MSDLIEELKGIADALRAGITGDTQTSKNNIAMRFDLATDRIAKLEDENAELLLKLTKALKKVADLNVRQKQLVEGKDDER